MRKEEKEEKIGHAGLWQASGPCGPSVEADGADWGAFGAATPTDRVRVCDVGTEERRRDRGSDGRGRGEEAVASLFGRFEAAGGEEATEAAGERCAGRSAWWQGGKVSGEAATAGVPVDGKAVVGLRGVGMGGSTSEECKESDGYSSGPLMSHMINHDSLEAVP